MRFLPVNVDALLVELADLAQTLALLASLREQPLAGIVEMVPAARTLLVRFEPGVVAQAVLAQRIARRPVDARVEARGRRVEIPVRYDGEDLQEVARLLGITPAEVVRRHTGADYGVAFTGFAPGFAYLAGGDRGLDVPRRGTPRTRIPAGAVGLAGAFSGVYPQDSPGGWQIIGVTDLPMWDLARPQPALLQPGDRVRFVEARGAGLPAPPAARAEAVNPPDDAAARLEVRRAGLQALFQDLGRPGQAGQGLSASGAMDRRALRSANRLVGNAVGDAAIEIAHGGFEIACRGDAVVAVTGADGPLSLYTPDGICRPVPRHAPIALNDGDRLAFGEPAHGVRSYLAVRGGFDIPAVLGSRAADTLARVGPPALAAGDRLAIRRAAAGAIVGAPEAAPPALPAAGDVVTLDVVMGPRTDWFTPESIALLEAQPWTITPQSNRIGLRLDGARPLVRCAARAGVELPSEGTSMGALQVPPSGQPVLFLADHPLTGGYPVIGCVAPHHLDLAGQLPVGARLRLRPLAAFEEIAPPPPSDSRATP
jgi:KipI family sensor histidine kinase inhibitor